jgi:hypothetical protein
MSRVLKGFRVRFIQLPLIPKINKTAEKYFSVFGSKKEEVVAG